MPSSVRDFRTYSRTTLTLPSGLSVLVRRCQLQDFLTLAELPVPATGTASEERDARTVQRDNRLMADLLIVHCCVSPRFAPRHEPEREDSVGIEELDSEDFNALANGILEHSGLAPGVAAALQQFRPDEEREAGGPDGGEVPRPAPPDPAGDPGGVLPGPAAGDLAGGGGTASEPVAATTGAHHWVAQPGTAASSL